MSFHGLLTSFFLALNNTLLSGYIRVYLSIHQLKYILIASKFGQLWMKLLLKSKCRFLCGYKFSSPLGWVKSRFDTIPRTFSYRQQWQCGQEGWNSTSFCYYRFQLLTQGWRLSLSSSLYFSLSSPPILIGYSEAPPQWTLTHSLWKNSPQDWAFLNNPSCF